MAALAAASLLGGLLEADCVLVGQLMLSRPAAAGPLAGAALWFLLGTGESPWQVVSVCAVFGWAFELMSLEELPVGSAVPMNGCVAAVVASSSYALLESRGLPGAEAAFPAAWCAGMAFSRVERALRESRSRLSARAEAALAEGRDIPWARIISGSVARQVAASSAFMFAVSAALFLLLPPLLAAVPEALREGAALSLRAALPLGLAVLLHSLAGRRAWTA